MSNPIPYCSKCAGKHWVSECPELKPLAKVGEIIRAKKPWVKPELRVYKRVDKMSTECLIGLLKERGIGDVSTPTVDKKSRQEYQREWIKRKRGVI